MTRKYLALGVFSLLLLLFLSLFFGNLEKFKKIGELQEELAREKKALELQKLTVSELERELQLSDHPDYLINRAQAFGYAQKHDKIYILAPQDHTQQIPLPTVEKEERRNIPLFLIISVVVVGFLSIIVFIMLRKRK